MTNLDVVNPDGSVPEFNGKDDLQEWIKNKKSQAAQVNCWHVLRLRQPLEKYRGN